MSRQPLAGVFPSSTSLVVATLFVAALYSAHLAHFGWFFMASDDSYIYLGYVRNWVERFELFTYNPGEPSAGTTGLLYYYLLSIVATLVAAVYYPSPAAALPLVAYLTNAALFLSSAALIARICRATSSESMRRSRVTPLLLLAIMVSQPHFIWGWFGGLENPLTATIILWLLERALACAPAWQIGSLSALLGACRPELLPIGVMIAVAGAFAQPAGAKPRNGTMPRAIAGGFAFAAMSLVLFLPSWLITGALTPSALGTRISIPALTDPLLWWTNLHAAYQQGYFLDPWVLGAPVLLAALGLAGHARTTRVMGFACGLLTFYLLMRAALALTDFNIRDRYVSFLWPLYVLAATHALVGMAERTGWTRQTGGMQRFLPGLVWAAIITLLPIAARMADRQLSADVTEMNQVVVTPSLWMARNLPHGARVVMEPAGAIRLFADHYLIDVVGLTTRHLSRYRNAADDGSLSGFLAQTQATHVFDYPGRVPELSDPSRFVKLHEWSPAPQRYSLGRIGVFSLTPSAPTTP